MKFDKKVIESGAVAAFSLVLAFSAVPGPYVPANANSNSQTVELITIPKKVYGTNNVRIAVKEQQQRNIVTASAPAALPKKTQQVSSKQTSEKSTNGLQESVQQTANELKQSILEESVTQVSEETVQEIKEEKKSKKKNRKEARKNKKNTKKEETKNQIIETASQEVSPWSEKLMPNVEEYLNIRTEASEEAELAGKLHKGAGAEILEQGDYQMLFLASEYKTASDEVNAQCDTIKGIIRKYDASAMLIGEAPCTQDLITITDKDFKTVSTVSIVLIFMIIAIVLKSISLPVILVAVIEFAIFINMGIPAFTGTVLPFIASIVIGTIQLGATVDYAILITNKYKKARYQGNGKKEAVSSAMNSSLQSVFVSALSFFAATFGVGLYSSIDMISALCVLLARGALISLLVVAFVLPAMFMIFDNIICKTSAGFINNENLGVKGIRV